MHTDGLTRLIWYAGQGEAESASFAYLAPDPDGAMVGFNNVLDDAEP